MVTTVYSLLHCLQGAGTPHRGGHVGKLQASAAGEKHKTFVVVSGERNRRGEVRWLGIGQSEQFQWSWGRGTAPSCLVPGPGVMGAGG